MQNGGRKQWLNTVVAEVASQPYRFRGSIQQFSQFIGFLQSLMVLWRGEGEVGY